MKRIEEELVNKIGQKLSNEIDEMIIKGLKIKGYSFDNPEELSDFIKTNCRAEDNINLREKTFFVKDEPFLRYIYSEGLIHEFNDDKVSFRYDGGSFELI